MNPTNPQLSTENLPHVYVDPASIYTSSSSVFRDFKAEVLWNPKRSRSRWSLGEELKFKEIACRGGGWGWGAGVGFQGREARRPAGSKGQ